MKCNNSTLTSTKLGIQFNFTIFSGCAGIIYNNMEKFGNFLFHFYDMIYL